MNACFTVSVIFKLFLMDAKKLRFGGEPDLKEFRYIYTLVVLSAGWSESCELDLACGLHDRIELVTFCSGKCWPSF